MAPADRPSALSSTVAKLGPLKLTLLFLCLYLFLGAAYIIYSTSAASESSGSVNELRFFETVKGLLFIIVSGTFFSALLYALLRRLKATLDEITKRNFQLQEHVQRLQVIESELREEKVRAEEVSAGKSRFLSLISHEVRTPVHSILAAAELLDRDGSEEAHREYLDIVRTATGTLSDLVNRLLDFSTLEGRTAELWPEPFDVFQEIRLLVKPFHILAARKRQTFEYDVPEKCVVLGDRLRFGQVLRNLIDNAVKYTPETGRISLRATYMNEAGRVRIDITDSGPGVGSADKERIFQPFIQVDSGPARRHGGAGLGLAISREIVELAGGRLSVADAVDGGSVFTLEMPLKLSETIQRADESPDFSGPSLHVLVVEDNKVNLLLAERLLKKLGHNPACVMSGSDALAFFSKEKYDAVLLDLEMPEMNGLETAQKMRELEAGSELRTPIIALTAYESRQHREACRQAGFDGFVSKPASLAEIGKALSGIREQRASV